MSRSSPFFFSFRRSVVGIPGPSSTRMQLRIVFAIALLCVGMAVAFVYYIWLVCFSGRQTYVDMDPPSRGLSESDLQKLPRSHSLRSNAECAVCLEGMERGQSVRLLLPCHHPFHLQCIDLWLSRNPVCPVCRAPIQTPQIQSPLGN